MILVTGAAGLVGSELVRRISASGSPVAGTDSGIPAWTAGPLRVDAPFAPADLLDPDACRRLFQKPVEAVIHAAARQHHSQPPRWGRRAFFDANVRMTRNIVAAARDAGVRSFVYVSSDMVYGMPPGRPLVETDPPRPIGPYGESKLAGERVCLDAAGRRFDACVLRPRLIIGPGRLGILKKLFDRIRTGRTVYMLGGGRNRYQMVAVADVAEACIAAALRHATGVFNIGSTNPPTVHDLLSGVIRRAGSASRLASLPIAAANAALWTLHAFRVAPLVPEQFRIAGVDYVLDTSLARRTLGWTPAYSDDEMLWAAYQTYVDGPLGAVLKSRTGPARAGKADPRDLVSHP